MGEYSGPRGLMADVIEPVAKVGVASQAFTTLIEAQGDVLAADQTAVGYLGAIGVPFLTAGIEAGEHVRSQQTEAQ